MPAFFDPSLITFNGEEVSDISQILFEKQLQNPSLDFLHSIDEGIKAKKQIVIMGQLNGLLGGQSGGCDPTAASNTITPSEKFWDLATISDRLEFCYKELLPSFLNWTIKNGVEAADITDFVNFIVDNVLSNALAEAIFRNAWFGDTAAAETTDSPVGVITPGIGLQYFNKMDGLWKQLFAVGAADSDRITSGLATKNGLATFALQKFNQTDTTNKVAINVLDLMLTDADLALRQSEGLRFYSTQSFFDQYKRELKFANIAFTTEVVENGLIAIKSDGLDVIAIPLMDKIIKNYQSDGTRYHLPHRVALSTKEVLRIGTESVGTFNEFDIFYDKKSKKVIVDFELGLDAKVIFDKEVQTAY